MDGNSRVPETGDAPPAKAGFFDNPVFSDPSARALSQVGVIDVGSNSVRLVVFDGAARSPAYFFNEKVLCGLGKGLVTTGRLNVEGRVRALATIKRFALLAQGMAMTNLTMVATAAMREAEDGPEFQAVIERETGLRMRVIDGAEEARMSAQGVLTGWPEAKGLVCDIGGSSMELAVIGDRQVHQTVTSPLGPFRLQQVTGGKRGLRQHISAILKSLRDQVGSHHDALYLVGGSWRAIARLDMERRGYPLKVLHEYTMTPKSVRKTIDWIADQDLASLRARTGISAERMSLVPLAAQVLRQLVHVFSPQVICISSYGIREGILYEQMPDALRARDPLIEACHFMEHASARLPGFGKKLYNFLLPLYRNRPEGRLRLIRAACLLHDVNWRAHPDYRADACFDTSTRANLGGLDHQGRVYLGIALMYRYKTSGMRPRVKEIAGLLPAKDLAEAKMLGRALRFGSMFSMNGPENAGELRYFPKKHVLELVLARGMQALFTEVAEQRFHALAQQVDAQAKVRVQRSYNSKSGAEGATSSDGSGTA
ncbi:Ppx/GppA family phosphatase [Roseinatronobacter sp. S2]|uniref:Ppx/GppA family phosphatase n=1 Tax=Roseinatronobacter sp. S2 TaxID=3035471 RepID=UPI0024106099|nr:Ppx/GppA family phosphatase [Roseinatronobacter sp. S2]WFE73401.1 Ppx/GppA family phosphatase [Roseinatronobacter sp. S2]